MKVDNFSNKRHSCMAMLVIASVSVFFFNCSDLYMSSSNCIGNEGRECKQQGDSSWLAKKPTDILVVIDNSPKGEELNAQVAANLSQFVQCIDPVDWRVGVISSVEKKSGSTHTLGHLINLEMNGEVSVEKFVSANTLNYQKVLSDTVSMRSGCTFPPHCNNGSHKPLSAVKAFMERETNRSTSDAFLRSYAPLAIILVSSSDEDMGGLFSSSGTSSGMALSSVYGHYSENKFMALTVTKPADNDNCLRTFRDTASDGAGYVTKAGEVYGLVTLNPAVMFISSLLSELSESLLTNKPPEELIKFAKNSGGYAFNICKPTFGKAMAYSVLEKMNIAERFPEKCKKIKESESLQMAKFGN